MESLARPGEGNAPRTWLNQNGFPTISKVQIKRHFVATIRAVWGAVTEAR